MFSKMMSTDSLSSLCLIRDGASMSSRFVLDVDLRSTVQHVARWFALISCPLLASCINTSIVLCALYVYPLNDRGDYARTIICFSNGCGQPGTKRSQQSVRDQRKFTTANNQVYKDSNNLFYDLSMKFVQIICFHFKRK